jgi:cAMP-binding proteins - catabolite gene activator and regulatory subunit of cAMP-dependent protein kinases
MPALKQLIAKNRLLAALSPSAVKACELVELNFSDVLCESGERIKHVYFPVSSFISMITGVDSDESLEVGIIGAEGMCGASLVLGINIAPHQALVQGPGVALRMGTAAFARHLNSNARFEQDLKRYVYVVMRQLAQTAACSHFHDTSQRLARWLLMTRDRAQVDQFQLTHELLAYMLGVRRVGVTEAAGALHKLGLIDYRRGRIAILDVNGLEASACACYGQDNILYDSIMGKTRLARATVQ